MAGTAKFKLATKPQSESRIRKALPSDAAQLEALYHLLVKDPDVRVLATRIQEMNDNPLHKLLVVESGGRIVGTGLLIFCLDALFSVQPTAVFDNLVIHPDWRRRGLARQLLEHVIRLCAEKDCSKLTITSTLDRTEAHKLFRSLGFHDNKKLTFIKYNKDLKK